MDWEITFLLVRTVLLTVLIPEFDSCDTFFVGKPQRLPVRTGRYSLSDRFQLNMSVCAPRGRKLGTGFHSFISTLNK